MNIGIIGAGNLGTGLAKRLIAQGHSVMLSFTRSDDTLKEAAEALNARAGTPSEAARFGHVVILSSKWADTAEAIRQIGSIAVTKVLWDCSNPMKPDMTGLLIGTNTSGGEEVAKLAPWAKVVKAIPPCLHPSFQLFRNWTPIMIPSAMSLSVDRPLQMTGLTNVGS